MFIVFFLLRTYIIPEVLMLRMGDLLICEISISRDISAGICGVFIRLGLKGIIEDIFADRYPTQKMAISHIMMSEQNKGSGTGGPSGSGTSGPSGSGTSGPSGSEGAGEPSGSGAAGPSRPSGYPTLGSSQGKGVVTKSDYGSDSASDSAGPSNSKNPADNVDERVVTKSDYEPDSASDSDSSSNKSILKYPDLFQVHNVVNGHIKDLGGVSDKALERAREITETKINTLLESNLEGDNLDETIKKHSLIVEELQKRGEKEEDIKGKGKAKIEREEDIKGKGKRCITDSDYEWDSDSDKFRKEDHSDTGHPESEANKLVYGHPKDLEKASKESLEKALEAADFIKKDYAKRCVDNPNLKRHYTEMTRQRTLILDELDKIERGERKDIIKEDKGKEKKNK
jgi:hypothetical protein